MDKINFQKIKNLLPGIQKNISLAKYTTFKIGGPAKYFFVAKNKEDLILAVKIAKKFRFPFFILGGGSNILVSDKGFNGLVIKVQGSRFKVQGSTITTEAGVPLGKLVRVLIEKGLSGLEWVAGIPGTVGGAIYGNAGAFGSSMKDVVKKVEVLDVKKLKTELPFMEAKVKKRTKSSSPFKIYNFKDCKFSYRDSIFQKNKNLIILSVMFQLKRGNKKMIKNKIKKNLEQRKETQPLNFPSAGSIFKNPSGFSAGELGEEDKSSSSATEIPKEAKVRKRMKFSFNFAAAWLIEECGLKGKKIGNVKISEKHANFIVNSGNGRHPPTAQAKDVIKLIKLIKKEVKKKFGIKLEEEIQFLGYAHLTNFLEMKK